MKQVIEYVGTTNDGFDRYAIDGTRKGKHLTRESMAYIKSTMRKGDVDVRGEDGRGYRIVHIVRWTSSDESLQWVKHIEMD